MSTNVQVLSGFGHKAPAAILVSTDQTSSGKTVRILLDAGGSLDHPEQKGWELPDDLDAILISHDHLDHIQGLDEVGAEVPVYATHPVQKWLPRHLNIKTLPLLGEMEIAGVNVTTGQTGHSYGGVWLHLGVAGGVFYSGDISRESELFALTPPPPAHLALVDASYGLYDEPLASAKAQLKSLLDQPKSLLLPVPQTGRALEIAMWLTSQGMTDWTLGHDCLRPRDAFFGPQEAITQQALDALSAMPSHAFTPSAKVVLCGNPDGVGGEAETLLQQLDRYLPVYTGYLPPKAREQVAKGDAHYIRWNVHPRKSDLKWLITQLQCRLCVPLFHRLEDAAVWRGELGECITTKTQFMLPN